MATKDFRVRLSAEGQQEVVSAFRRVQQEAAKSKQSAVDASGGFNQLRDAARSVATEFLGYEAALRVFEGIKGAVEGSLEFAASMGKLQEKTGLSAVSLQVWAAAAKRVDVSQETVAKGLGLFAKAMGNLQQGSAKAAVSLQILLGSSKALNGLNTDQQLRKVTDALAKMSAGGQRAKITTDLFGKAGLELLPVLDQLGGEGFDKLKDKLQSFGALLTDSAIRQAKEAEETLGDLKIAASGLAMQFTEGLLDSVTKAAGGLTYFAEDADGAGSAIQNLGKNIGEMVLQLGYGFAYAMLNVRKYFDVLISDAKAAGQMLDTWHPFRDFAKINEERRVSELQAIRNYQADLSQLFTAWDRGEEAAAKAKEASRLKRLQEEAEVETTAKLAAAERLAKAKTGLEVEQARAALEVEKETNRQAVELEQERWKLGVESVTQYYATRRALAKTAADAEQSALAKQIASQQGALSKEKDPTKRLEITKAITELQAKADEQRLRSEGEVFKLMLEEHSEQDKLAQGVLTFEDKMLEAQGKRHEVELNAIKKEAEEYRKMLVQQGDPHADATVEQFTKVLTAQADYKEANRQLEESEKKLGESRRLINDEAERGIISQREKKKELIKLDQQWQPVLAAQLATLQQIAKTSALAPLIDEAKEARQKVDDLNAALNKTKDNSAELEKAFGKSIGEDLHKFLDRGSKDTDTLGKSFEKLALSVAANFASMLSKMMANKSKGGGGGSSSGGDGGIFSFLKGFSPQQNDAGGEITRGPYGRDRVPSWLTRGEFVVRKRVVDQPGMLPMLNLINQGISTPPLVKNRRFDTGGEVSQTSGGMVLGGGDKSNKAHLTVGLDYGLLLKGLEAHPGFGSVIVKHLGDNRNAANSALGK
jgi:hypothetical protein